MNKMWSLCKKRAHSPGDASGPRQIPKLNQDLLEHFPKIWTFLNPYLDFKDILVLTQCNKKLKQVIMKWVYGLHSNEYFFGCFQPDPNGKFRLFGETGKRSLSYSKDEVRDHFQQLGWFFRGLTALDSTSIRVQRAQDVMNRLQLVWGPTFKKLTKTMRDRSTLLNDDMHKQNLILLESGAIFAYAFILKITDPLRAFHYLIENADRRYGLRVTLGRILGNENYYYGAYGDIEFDTRTTLLHLFWNEVPSYLRGQWLVYLLRTYCDECERKEAALIYLMFGPMKTMTYDGSKLTWIMWDEPTNSCCVEHDDFRPLSNALSELHKERKLNYELLLRLFSDPNNLDIQFTDQVLNNHPIFNVSKFLYILFSFQSIALILLYASLDFKIFYLSRKIQDPNIIASAEVPGILAHMIIACSVLEMKPQDVYGLIHQIYKNEMKTEEEKRVMIDAVWFELSEYLRVSKYTFFCSLKKFGHEQRLF